MQQLCQKPPATHLGIRDEDPTVSYAETVVRDYGALLREPLHVLRLLREETLRDEQREVSVVDASSLDSLAANSARGKERRVGRRFSTIAERFMPSSNPP